MNKAKQKHSKDRKERIVITRKPIQNIFTSLYFNPIIKIFLAIAIFFLLTLSVSAVDIGIGTSTPSEDLDVLGNIKSDGVLYSYADPGYAPATQLITWGINKPVGPNSNLYIEWGNSTAGSMFITDHWSYTRPLYIRTGPIHLMAGDNYGLFVSTDGNVGIGTANPSEKLDVSGNVNVSGTIKSANLVGSGNRCVYADASGVLYTAASDCGTGGGSLWTSGAGLIYYNSGNVGIGTTTANQELSIDGDIDMIKGQSSRIHRLGEISFDWTTVGTYDSPQNHGIQSKNEAGNWGDELRINSYNDIINTLDANDNNAISYFKVQHHSTTDGEDLFWINSSEGAGYFRGDVGIGTTGPTQKLHVVGNIYASGDITCGGTCGGGGSLWTSGAGLIYYNSGNVGIGTASPDTLLDIESAGTPTLTVQTSATSGEDAIISIIGARTTSTTSNIAQIEFHNDISTPFQMAEISTRNADAVSTTSNSDLLFYVNNGAGLIEAMRIDDSGNVGLTDSNPACRLDLGGGTTCGSSDVRMKKNIQPLGKVLEKVTQLQPITFEWKTDKYAGLEDGKQIGFTAQDVEKVMPELVTIDDEGYKGIYTSKFNAILVQAIKELEAENKELKARLDALEAMI